MFVGNFAAAIKLNLLLSSIITYHNFTCITVCRGKCGASQQLCKPQLISAINIECIFVAKNYLLEILLNS